MEGAQTNPAWPPAGSGCHGSLNVRPSALPSSASLLWAPSSPLCWVTWASASHRIGSRAGVGSQTWHLGSFLIWGLQPGGSLSTSQPSVSSPKKWGQPSPPCREAAAGCSELRAMPSSRPRHSPRESPGRHPSCRCGSQRTACGVSPGSGRPRCTGPAGSAARPPSAGCCWRGLPVRVKGKGKRV